MTDKVPGSHPGLQSASSPLPRKHLATLRPKM